MKLAPLSLKWKLAVTATAAALSLIAVVAVIQTHFLKKDVAAGIATEQFTRVSQVAQNLDETLTNNLKALAGSAGALTPAAMTDSESFAAHFAVRSAIRVLFDDLLLVSVDGRITADYPTVAGRVGGDASDRPYFKHVMTRGTPIVSEPFVGRATGEPIVIMAVPVRAADGSVIAILAGTVRLLRPNVLGNLATAKIGETGYFYALTTGPEPRYVVHPQRERILQPRPPNAAKSTTRALVEGFEGTLQDVNAKGDDALLSYRRLQSTGWLLVGALPVAEAFAPIDEAEHRILVVSLLVALLVGPLAWWFTWRVFAPLTRLLETMNRERARTGDGELAPSHELDEFGLLSHAFADLTAQRGRAQADLLASERRIRTITDNLPALICYIDREHRFRFNNRNYERWLNKPMSEICDRPVAEVYGPVVYERLKPAIEGALGGERTDFEVDFDGRDGRVHHVRGRYRPDVDGNGVVQGIYGLISDVTQLKEAEDALAENRGLLQVTLESIADAVITTDVAGAIRWMNPTAERMTGWSRADAEGRPSSEVFVTVDEETRLAAADTVERCITEGTVVELPGRTLLLSKAGAEFGIENSASPIRDARGRLHGAVLIFRDVSEQRRLSLEMTHRATHDALTGLVNRAEFESRLGRVRAAVGQAPEAHAMLYIDLDQFKLVNDACGHSVGDQLLRQVGGILRACVRGRDTVARLGGDEFGVLLEHCDVEQANRVAQKICDQMEEFRFVHDQQRFRVGASIGLVPFDARWNSVAAALQAADISCYAAKEGGRNRVHVWLDTDHAMKARHAETQWVSRIESALDEDRFELYAQRIQGIGAKPDRGLHCEVLLRLRDTDGTLVPPGAFLPAAERFRMVTRIDRWVVREVFERLHGDHDFVDGLELIAINLSGHSIGDRSFHRDIGRAVRKASFDVRKLCFEITETAAVTNFVDAKAFIDEMRELGVKIALDDFGAGASSFGYLKTLPVDYLKIDGQFITDLLEDALDGAAVRCFREVARAVGVRTIAEFVEKQEVQDALTDIGIDMAQGYLIHRPEPLANLALAFG